MTLKKILLCTAGMLALAQSAFAVGDVVISQVYGGSGCATAGCSTYGNDYIELYNRSAASVTMTGWSVQYASATGTGLWTVTPIPTFTLLPGQYFLIAEGAGAAGTGVNAIPTADATGAISMSGTNGKVSLVSNITALSGACPTGATILDRVGYGTTPNCSETAVTGAALTTTTAAFRKNGGCQDTDNNASDFLVQAPSPRNSTTISACPSSTPPTGTGSASPGTVCPMTTVTFTVVTSSGANPTSLVTSVTADMQAIALTAAEVFTQSPTNTWTFTTSLANVGAGTYNLPVTITDALNRVGSSSISLIVTSCNPTILFTGTGASPSGICSGSTTTISAVVQPGQNPTSVSFTVTADLTAIGGSATAPLTLSGPNTYTASATVAPATPIGAHAILVTATEDAASGGRIATRTINVVTAPCTASASTAVISQVYGGGGNSGATFKDDFVELFNRSGSPVDLTGWSLQYSPVDGLSGGFGGGTFNNNPVPLSGTIQPGRYYLIQLSRGSGGTQDLPTPDLVPATANLISVGSTGGIFAVVEGVVTPLGTNACANPAIRDLVGYGTFGTPSGPAFCYEGSADLVGAVPSLSNTTAALRNQNGCQDNNRNRIDFSIGDPAPRNSATPANNCVPVTPTGSCCAPAGTCGTSTQAACVGPSVWTLNGVCSPNTCPQPATGVCCRGATCITSLTSQSACTGGIVGSPTAGAFFAASGTVCNAGAVSNSPCCYADYNKVNGVSVQDIFDFLADWFAGFPYANTGGTGSAATLTVQNIFDFLSNWFAGGC